MTRKPTLDFLARPPRTTKPRKRGLTVASDKAKSPAQARDFVATVGDIADHMKIPDHVGVMWRYSAAFLRNKNRVYPEMRKMLEVKRGWAALLALAAALAVAAAAPAQEHPQHRFDRAEKWALVFDDPARDEWQRPEEVIRALALAPDASVADIGAGTGYFAVRLARAVPQGRVIGVDVEQDMVRYLAERAKREGLANLTTQLGAANDPRLPAPVDLVMLVDTYHHIPARERYFARLREGLKPGGRLAIIDFHVDAPMGPPQRFRISPERVKQELMRAGFGLVQEHNFLPHQYFLVFRPAARGRDERPK